MTPAEQSALRHLVYLDLIGLLHPASAEQTETFAANLNLLKFAGITPKTKRKLNQRLLLLRVSPDIAEADTGSHRRPGPEYIENTLNRCYADRLRYIAGF